MNKPFLTVLLVLAGLATGCREASTPLSGSYKTIGLVNNLGVSPILDFEPNGKAVFRVQIPNSPSDYTDFTCSYVRRGSKVTVTIVNQLGAKVPYEFVVDDNALIKSTGERFIKQ